MAMHGNIIFFSSHPEDPKARAPRICAEEIVSLLEKHRLVSAGTSARSELVDDCSVTFSDYHENSELSLEDYAYVLIEPDSLTPELSTLVYLLDEDSEGKKGAIELPYIEITVLRQPQAVVDFVSGDQLGTTWAAIEFSYEDVHLSEEIHTIRDEGHPFLIELREVFGTPIEINVVCY